MNATTLTDIDKEIQKLEDELIEKKKQLSDLRKKTKPKLVKNYTLIDINGKPVTLSELFKGKKELVLVHNMGKSCPYCTLWADGYNGFTQHLENRVPFVVVSPDEHTIMKEFAQGRNWKFKIYSSNGATFKRDVNFETEKGMFQPGVTILTKNGNGEIFENSRAYFGPGDNYCPIWDFFDLLPEGSNQWAPKYNY